jgi:hypothetical protein
VVVASLVSEIAIALEVDIGVGKNLMETKE